MADKKSNEPRRENGRIPTYQTAYHGAKKKDPLTNLARIIVEKFDKRRVPENTIDTIPFDQIYPDGLCRIGDNFYSKMVQFYDINYQLAQNDEKQHIFAEYCQFLNYFDETIHFQFCFINQRVDMEEYKKVISIPDQDDEFNVVRREYATYLRNQLEKGNNGIVKSKYLVFGIEARDRKQAVSRLAKIESDVINKFKLLGCKCVPVNGLERLRIMHDYLNQDSLEKFAMKSFKDVVESGLTPKNFITPTSFDFRAKDYYKIGDMFATTNFLVISAPEISDEMLADILNMEDALSVTMHIDTLNQTEAMKYIKGKLSDINKMKIEEQKKAIVTSYEPTTQSVRTATSDLSQESEEEYKKSIYERMLGGKKVSEFEKDVKEKFKEEPANMKLLIVVDKLLTGFDAPSATYLYIDKSMRDHDLFQAICRVNRPDGEDKDYGYIVDYMDLFRNVQLAVADYTSEAFDQFDKGDVDGLIKNRYDEAKSELEGSIQSLDALIENVSGSKSDIDYIEYFCGDDSEDDEKTARRDALYALTASLTRSFANCCDKLVSDYKYSEDDVENLRSTISGYNKIKEMIKLASCDYIDLKPYEADMRYILDTYIRAEDSNVISEMGNMSLVELLLQGKTTTPIDLVKGLPGNDTAKAETIENNLQHEIVKKMSSNSVYYGKLSEMLQKIITQRKIEAMSYEEYLRQVVEMAEAILHPEDSGNYPDEIKDSAARRALFDYFESDVDLTIDVDSAIRMSIEPAWKKNFQKQQRIRLAIYKKLLLHSYAEDKATEETNNVFEIAQRQEEYDA